MNENFGTERKLPKYTKSFIENLQVGVYNYKNYLKEFTYEFDLWYQRQTKLW